MSTCMQLLLDELSGTTARSLLIADENILQNLDALSTNANIELLSNRYDVFSQACAKGITSHYSDFDFTVFTPRFFDTVLYRVSKERPVAHHVINHAFALLSPGGKLVLTGAKNEGIKSYATHGCKLFGSKAAAQKHGTDYRAVLIKSGDTPGPLLDSKDYPTLRSVSESGDIRIHSKPGVFGWNKLDKGSELLMGIAQDYLKAMQSPPESVLDLGCGYGYLTLNTKYWPSIKERWATDNNAAAILCMEENAKINEMRVTVTADDCAKHIEKQFDMILCNPPFHQGFEVDGSLTVKFLEQTRRHLKNGGVGLFVVNQFIPIPKLASGQFKEVSEIGGNSSFRVYALIR